MVDPPWVAIPLNVCFYRRPKSEFDIKLYWNSTLKSRNLTAKIKFEDNIIVDTKLLSSFSLFFIKKSLGSTKFDYRAAEKSFGGKELKKYEKFSDFILTATPFLIKNFSVFSLFCCQIIKFIVSELF